MSDFWTGGAAAIAAISVMHPVDVVKTRIQVQGELGKTTGTPYRGVLRSLFRIGREEGARGLYRGLTSAYGLQFSVTATRFGVYGLLKEIIIPTEQEMKQSTAVLGAGKFILALVSGGLSGVVGTPFYALKTRAQAQTAGKPLGLFNGIVEVYQSEGIKGYARGMNAFTPRVMAYGAVQLSVYDTAKQIFQEHMGMIEGLKLHVASSFAAALLSVAAIQPFDFVAVRLMNQPVDPVTKKPILYNGALDCVRKVVKEEGPKALLKGLGANYSRMFPYTVLVFIFFEQFKLLKAQLTPVDKPST